MKNIRYMILYKSWLKACAVACFLVSSLFLSCNGGAEGDTTEGIAIDSAMETDDSQVTENQVYYQIPAPDEMISFIKLGGFEYDGSILNPADNFDLHVEQKSQSLNLGIYTADLTYMATFGQFQESARYFNSIMKLSDKLGISSAFDEALIGRVKNNLENTDSLETISNDSYYSIVDDLERSQRGKTLAVIAAGGWLESVYIVVNLMEGYKTDDPMVQRLADQKLVFENLTLYLKKYESEPMVQSTLEQFNGLKTIFDGLDETSTSTAFKINGAKKVLGGAGKVNMTEEQFNTLKNEVISLRNSIAAVNS